VHEDIAERTVREEEKASPGTAAGEAAAPVFRNDRDHRPADMLERRAGTADEERRLLPKARSRTNGSRNAIRPPWGHKVGCHRTEAIAEHFVRRAGEAFRQGRSR
jgi:hypothetical protein